MKPSAVKGTVARLWEGLFLSTAENISAFAWSDARFPPYFFRILIALSLPILVLVAFTPSNPMLILVLLTSILLIVLSIPIITYLSLKNTEYIMKNSTLVKKETFLGGSKEDLDLRNAEDLYISRGLVGKILGIGKVCIKTDKDIFQVDYVNNPKQVKEDIESALRP